MPAPKEKKTSSPKKRGRPRAKKLSRSASFLRAATSFLTKNKKKARKRGRKPKKPTYTSIQLSGWALLSLFLGAILCGVGLFFLTHSLERYHFQNPFTEIEKEFIQPSAPPAPAYTMNYTAYETLSKNISIPNKIAIQNFLQSYPNSPLSRSLRNKWLIVLAKENYWEDFIDDYRPTNNEEVECYYLQALYHSGRETLALSGVKRLWKAGYKPTSACQAIFLKWQKSGDFKEKYIWPRLQLALDQKDASSVQQLTQMLPSSKQIWVSRWIAIRKNPTLISSVQLPDNSPGRRIVIDGLKQLASTDVTAAIAQWPTFQKKYHFSTAMSQDFYRTASLHLVLIGDPRAETWFSKILPSYGTAQSRAWQVRFALTHRNWVNVLSLIQAMPLQEQQENIWQYWKARALQGIGQSGNAAIIYKQLSTQRQYYGFLAAYQLKQPLAIQQEDYPTNNSLLEPYRQQIAQIKNLYEANHKRRALQLTEDLLNQLDPIGRYTLAHTFAEWEWYSESMNIVNRSPYQNDLKLRFPFPHRSLVLSLATKANISPAFIYSIARQESNFHEDVFSSAGGLGILQITLSTAQQFSPNITKEDLYHPQINLMVSLTYLKKLTQQFKGHPLLIASAYNAGPQKTRNWQPKNGPMSADIWIEIRPWEETRNYLKNILAYNAVYQYLLGQTPNINLFMQNIPANP
jgi:soluble lytic murein transglycosylase